MSLFKINRSLDESIKGTRVFLHHRSIGPDLSDMTFYFIIIMMDNTALLV